jgi:hypothetical protein
LRSFKNKFEHWLLDRHVGAELTEYLLSGSLPEFDPQRLENSTALLFNDLLRQGLSGIALERDGAAIRATTNNGENFVIALSSPLTADHPAESGLASANEQANAPMLLTVNELLIRGNLPAATRDIMQRLGV